MKLAHAGSVALGVDLPAAPDRCLILPEIPSRQPCCCPASLSRFEVWYQLLDSNSKFAHKCKKISS
jgi:hypothetical protein